MQCRTKEGYVRPDYDVVIGPIADNTLQDWFNKMDHYVKKMTMMLAGEFNLSVESAMQFVLASSCFKDLHEKDFLLEEGDLFHFDLLKKEFCSKQEQLAKS